MTPPAEPLYYVTALSNLARGYDKYARAYDKARIPESTFPDRFFLLGRGELAVGLAKAAHLPAKTGLPGDTLIALQTRAAAGELRPNLRTGLGRYVERGRVGVDAVHLVDDAGGLVPIGLEEAVARSYQVLLGPRPAFDRLTPRSVSVLPIAKACPARCPFCFSKASASDDTAETPVDWDRVGEIFAEGRVRGAGRAVITGGGEPSLLREPDLHRLIRTAAAAFPKVVLITNGFAWGRLEEEPRAQALRRLDETGLTVLAVSRHAADPRRNAALMHLETRSEAVARTWASLRRDGLRLALRWICVLQRGGVEDRASLERYLDAAVADGVEEVCFKELYVSTSVESEYHDRDANAWSARHQVPLSLVLELAREAGWEEVHRLPWGSPVFEGPWRNRRVRVAAYTEPSLLWELSHGQCRSWNLMADGRCLASLEDRNSEVFARGLRGLPALS